MDEEENPLTQGAQSLGSIEMPGNQYGGETVEDHEQIDTPNPEEPKFLRLSELGAFGDTENSEEFTHGGATNLPDGNINPENFARVKESLVKSGTLRIGDSFRLLNPKTKKVVPVIVRGIKPDGDAGPAVDVAPHVVLELGGTKNILLHSDPVKGYPVARYSHPYVSADTLSDVLPATESAQLSLGDVSLDGAGPSGVPMSDRGVLKNASAIDQPAPSYVPLKTPQGTFKVQKANGDIVAPDGRTFHMNGTYTFEQNGLLYTYDTRTDKIIGSPKDLNKSDTIKMMKDETGADRPYVEKNGQMVRVPVEGESLAAEMPEGVTGDDAIKDLSPADQAAVKAFATYSRQPPTAGRANPTYNRLEKYIFAYRPDYAGSLGFKEATTVTNEFASTRSGVAGGQIIAANTAMKHLSRLSDVTDKLDGSKVRKLNGLVNYLKTETGNPNVQEFNRERDTLVGEFQKMITGGVPYADDVRRGIDQLNAANAPDQLKSVIKSMAGLMSDKLSEMDFRYSNVFKKPYDGLVNPEAEKIAQKFGIKDFAGRNKLPGSNAGESAATPTPALNAQLDAAIAWLAAHPDDAKAEEVRKRIELLSKKSE